MTNPNSMDYESAREMDDDMDGDMEADMDGDVRSDIAAESEDARKREELRWNSLTMKDKCWDIVNIMASEGRRWDDLELYKKTGLINNQIKSVDNPHPTALHVFADKWKDFKDRNVKVDILKTIINHLLAANVGCSASKGTEMPVLFLAMNCDNDEFIDCVLDCSTKSFADLLDDQVPTTQKNCLHRIFARNNLAEISKIGDLGDSRKKCFERAKKYVKWAKKETLAAKDKDGNTPVHCAMDYCQCWKRDGEYIQIVKDMILKGDPLMRTRPNGAVNNRDESPILYCQRTRDEYNKRKAALRTKAQPVRTTPQSQIKRENDENHKAHSGQETPIERGKFTAETGALSEKISIAIAFLPDQKRLRASVKNDAVKHTDTFDSSGIARSHTNVFPSSQNAGTIPTKPMGPPASKTSIVSSTGQLDGKGKPAVKAPQQSQNNAPIGPEKEPPRHKADDGESSVNELLKFLRLHYIRTRSDLESRDLMHGRDASDKNLYFDATGHKGAETIIKLINRMAIGGFGETLAYVYLPIVSHTPQIETVDSTKPKMYGSNEGKLRQKKPKKENPSQGRTALVSVFTKLYDEGVRNILRLHVEDREPPHHTDVAIETALRGSDSISGVTARDAISVETWDWRRPDLSTDVIAFAAPTVEVVNLYWTGNQSVLAGWSATGGIPRLYNETKKKLKKIILHAAPGLESRERMDKMLERFKNQVETRTSNGVVVEIIPRMSGLFPTPGSGDEMNDSPDGKVKREKQHEWILEMQVFRGALFSVHKALSDMKIDHPKRVKVALIDDGVDLDHLETYGNNTVISKGVSYCPPEGRSERPWHVSSGGHGTIMANMIARINPWVELYCMKLHDSLSPDGGRTIYAESAARAIRGAIHRKVDIISMSWTVEEKIDSLVKEASDKDPKDAPPSPIAMLRGAIREAVDHNILLFCSASDNFKASSMASLPYAAAPEYIFRIGAALSLGQPDPHANDKQNIDYYFPGTQVADVRDPKALQLVKYYDGSSVSTALAAGLASLIIYCATIMQTYHRSATFSKDPGRHDKFAGFVKALRVRDNMKRAFENIDSDSWDQPKYLPVWDMFGTKGKEIESADKATGKSGKFEHLEKLVEDLCSKLK